jgi:type II secretory ATPase GspE/PulE/Tfp pilus assembly ATPase PilB-like protein
MSGDLQSIENLISASKGKVGEDNSPAAQFARKQAELKDKQIEREAQAKAAAVGLPYVSLVRFPISPEALSLIPREESKRLSLVCFFYDGKSIKLATDKPSQEAVALLEHLSAAHFADGELYAVSTRSIVFAMSMYDRLPRLRKLSTGVEISLADLEKFKQEISDYKSLDEKINKASMSDVVTMVMATALKTNASDIHIEAEEAGIAVRFRIDGVLQEAANMDRDQWKKIISRLKLLAKVKLNITDKPQDGRFTIFFPEEKVEVRCSFLPTSYGESVVMRLLHSSSVALSFDDLGLRHVQLELLDREIAKPNGLILTTGPTGSGKTTTLYAILNKLNSPDSKIITLEDPIEYKLDGINQSQVDPSRDYTFAKGLRSILRQDPDIVMVGEMRDYETAEIAVQASLTGHLVLSTLHTNDAAGVIPRLIDMGVKPFFLVPSVNCIIGQRLVRKICPHCRQPHTLTFEEEEKVKKILAVISPKAGVDVPSVLPAMYKAGAGCEQCQGIGYKGRLGIYEIFTMDNDIKQLTTDGAPSFRILQKAIENGMVTMLQDGILKCLEGVTDLDEVIRVIGKLDYIDDLYDIIVAQTIGRGIRINQVEMALAAQLAKDNSLVTQTIAGRPTREVFLFGYGYGCSG